MRKLRNDWRKTIVSTSILNKKDVPEGVALAAWPDLDFPPLFSGLGAILEAWTNRPAEALAKLESEYLMEIATGTLHPCKP